MRIFEAGVRTVDLPRIEALRMRVSMSPRGSFIVHCVTSPYQLDLTMPGIWPFEARSRSAMRDMRSLR